jgi:hypothetical protein
MRYPLLDLGVIAATVQEVYEVRMIQYVVGVESIAYEKALGDAIRDSLLLPSAFTAAVSGFLLEDISIEAKIADILPPTPRPVAASNSVSGQW